MKKIPLIREVEFETTQEFSCKRPQFLGSSYHTRSVPALSELELRLSLKACQ